MSHKTLANSSIGIGVTVYTMMHKYYFVVLWIGVVTVSVLSNLRNQFTYRHTSNIRRTFLGNQIVDHSDVVGASPAGVAPTTFSFATHGFNGLDKNNCKMRREPFKFCDLVPLILEILRYISLWRHVMETLPVLPALCGVNPSVTRGFPS